MPASKALSKNSNAAPAQHPPFVGHHRGRRHTTLEAEKTKNAHWHLDEKCYSNLGAYEKSIKKIKEDAGPEVENGKKGISLLSQRRRKAPFLLP